jgi:hypothetical protein
MSTVMKIAIGVLIITSALYNIHQARADSLIIHGVSNHYGTDVEYNERNYGAAYSRPINRYMEARGGVFINSYDNVAPYIGVYTHTNHANLLAFGLQGGVAGGYDNTPMSDKPLMPVLMPTVSIGSRTVRAEVGLIPLPETPVLTLSFRIEI